MGLPLGGSCILRVFKKVIELSPSGALDQLQLAVSGIPVPILLIHKSLPPIMLCIEVNEVSQG